MYAADLLLHSSPSTLASRVGSGKNGKPLVLVAYLDDAGTAAAAESFPALRSRARASSRAGVNVMTLETPLRSRAHASELGLELRDAKASLAKVEESRDLYKERCKLQEKEIFALERQNEETKKGFDTGMAVAKRQIKMLEEMLDEAKKAQ